ncbi:hypothetical protein [Burkholderia aenigmatica]|nr:hypothetical protein [Burkholderia aenigmatica]
MGAKHTRTKAMLLGPAIFSVLKALEELDFTFAHDGTKSVMMWSNDK